MRRSSHADHTTARAGTTPMSSFRSAAPWSGSSLAAARAIVAATNTKHNRIADTNHRRSARGSMLGEVRRSQPTTSCTMNHARVSATIRDAAHPASGHGCCASAGASVGASVVPSWRTCGATWVISQAMSATSPNTGTYTPTARSTSRMNSQATAAAGFPSFLPWLCAGRQQGGEVVAPVTQRREGGSREPRQHAPVGHLAFRVGRPIELEQAEVQGVAQVRRVHGVDMDCGFGPVTMIDPLGLEADLRAGPAAGEVLHQPPREAVEGLVRILLADAMDDEDGGASGTRPGGHQQNSTSARGTR